MARDCHTNCSGILTRHHRHLEERSQRVRLVIVTGTVVTRFCSRGWFSGYYGLDFTSIVANGSVGYCYWYCGYLILDCLLSRIRYDRGDFLERTEYYHNIISTALVPSKDCAGASILDCLLSRIRYDRGHGSQASLALAG